MSTDVKTIIWKERKLLFSQRGGRKQVFLSLFLPAAIFAIVFPWQEGAGYLASPLAIFASIFIPMLIVMLTIPESFAGERERHTLETLLASRLSDSDILFGKILVSVVLAVGIFLVSFFIAFIIANISDWTGILIFYNPIIGIGSIFLSILIATISSLAGVLISLKSPTVREAQQSLMAVIMFPVLLLGVAGTLVFTIEGIRETITNIMDKVSPAILLSVVIAILLIACYFLLKIVQRRFQRSKLIAD